MLHLKILQKQGLKSFTKFASKLVASKLNDNKILLVYLVAQTVTRYQGSREMAQAPRAGVEREGPSTEGEGKSFGWGPFLNLMCKGGKSSGPAGQHAFIERS